MKLSIFVAKEDKRLKMFKELSLLRKNARHFPLVTELSLGMDNLIHTFFIKYKECIITILNTEDKRRFSKTV